MGGPSRANEANGIYDMLNRGNRDANGDSTIDGTDFGIWNSMKFTDWTFWPSVGQQSMMSSGSGISPSATWLSNFNHLLQRHRSYREGVINSSLRLHQWEGFANELIALFRQI